MVANNSEKHVNTGVSARVGSKNEEWKEVRPRRKAVIGTSKCNSKFKGAPPPDRDLFLYRVDSDFNESNVTEHIEDNNVKVRNIEIKSVDEARFKSFKITVSVKDVEKMLHDDFWPEGVMIRRWRNPKNQTKKHDDE